MTPCSTQRYGDASLLIINHAFPKLSARIQFDPKLSPRIQFDPKLSPRSPFDLQNGVRGFLLRGSRAPTRPVGESHPNEYEPPSLVATWFESHKLTKIRAFSETLSFASKVGECTRLQGLFWHCFEADNQPPGGMYDLYVELKDF